LVLSLRKGPSSVVLNSALGSDRIGAETIEAEVIDETVVVRIRLRLIDGTEISDEDNLHSRPLRSVEIADGYVLKNLRKFWQHHAAEISGWRIEIVSNGEMVPIPVSAPHWASGLLRFDLKCMND
jgi:hypothetical protein